MGVVAEDDPIGLDQTDALLAGGLVVDDVTDDSRDVAAGSVYACLRGAAFDGHDFAAAAVDAGAVALVVDHRLDNVGDTPQILVDDTRRRIGPIAALLSGHPSRQLTAVGITGTNGKTTTAQLLEAIFTANGWPTGVVGTLHGPRTTPEAAALQGTLRRFVADGDKAAVLEVSSHALALHRVDGTEFDAVAFTNLGRDHLDLHGSQEEYFRAKARLFSSEFAPLGVINVDDPHGRLLADTAASDVPGSAFRVVAVSTDDISDVRVGAASHGYRWNGLDVDVPIGGRFNVSNSLVALCVARELGVDAAVAVDALRTVPVVPGRFQLVRTPAAERLGLTVVVDYAHTPDGLAEVLESARAIASGSAVTVVFGCGGERDRPKRPEMGRVAAALADHVVVTSDNPRSEDPMAIIDDILEGVEADYGRQVVTEPDRRSAIHAALEAARAGDVVVIAGKGHERSQEYADRTLDFDDVEVASEILEALA
jgi:UDP-N-acetylmuramoyl-L-alanyl-D-glutamate--2,6-diaminopimelate ligase